MSLGTMLTAVIALAAAGLTGLQLYLSERNNARQLRAYLTMIVDEVGESHNNPDNMFIDFHLANVGQTPAYGVETAVAVAGNALKDHEIASRLSPQEGVSILGGDDRSDFRVPLGLKASEVRALDDRNERIYVYGTVRYVDIYRESHRLSFCRYLRGNIKEALFLPCKHFNVAD